MAPAAADHIRAEWMAVLATADGALLAQLMEPVAVAEMEHVRPTETGLVMVRGRAGGVGQRFNLGEVTVTRASIRLGAGPVGHAFVMGRDRRHAELAAAADALLQDPCRHDAMMREVVLPLRTARDAARERVARKAAATRVDFFTLVRGEG